MGYSWTKWLVATKIVLGARLADYLGSGKTTLLSLITSDHPQAYAAPLKLFGRSRLPVPGQPGISLFDIQSRIGHSSPEIHAFFPRHLTVRQVIESAFADTPVSRPKMQAESDTLIDNTLRWFQSDLISALGIDPPLREEIVTRTSKKTYRHKRVRAGESTDHAENYAQPSQKYDYEYQEHEDRFLEWAEQHTFGELTFSAQRVALFLRAIIAQPDIVILDEAFSGMDEQTRDKCMSFLEYGETRRQQLYEPQTLKFRPFGLGEIKRPYIENTKRKLLIFRGLAPEQALVVVSHVQEEVPKCVRNFLYLPKGGTKSPCAYGTVEEKFFQADYDLWHRIWDVPNLPRKTLKVGEVLEEEPTRDRTLTKYGKPKKRPGRPVGCHLPPALRGNRRRILFRQPKSSSIQQ